VESSGSEDDESLGRGKNVADSFNRSIYMMLAVPYTLLGVFGFLIYRGMRKNEAFRNAQMAHPAANAPDSPHRIRRRNSDSSERGCVSAPSLMTSMSPIGLIGPMGLMGL
jgi:hypothetical protein